MDVYTPFFAPHSRVDLVACRDAEVLRVQCKSGRVISGALYFPTCSNTKNLPLDYRDQIDGFGVFAPTLDLVYLVPVDGLPIRGCCLRLEPTRNNQKAGIRWATDYLIGRP
jgi:hypothetical protein